MRILFLVNDVAEMIARQATTLLMMAAAAQHDVWVCGVSDLSWSSDGDLVARAARVGRPDRTGPRFIAGLRQQTKRPVDLYSCDAVMIRTNPGRDPHRLGSHEVALQLLEGAAERGLVIVNAPSALRRASTKAYLTELPAQVVPPLIVSRDPKAVTAWIEALDGPAVVKPVRGTRGQDVFLVEGGRSNLPQIIDVIQRDGYVMAQAFVPGGEAGDVRVLVLDGKVLEVDGRAAAFARVPHRKDFRSNLATGGTAEPAAVDGPKRAAIAAIRKHLRREGLFLVGVDFIGNQIIELNAFSPGGLGSAGEHQERDFARAVIDALVERVHAPQRPATRPFPRAGLTHERASA